MSTYSQLRVARVRARELEEAKALLKRPWYRTIGLMLFVFLPEVERLFGLRPRYTWSPYYDGACVVLLFAAILYTWYERERAWKKVIRSYSPPIADEISGEPAGRKADGETSAEG